MKLQCRIHVQGAAENADGTLHVIGEFFFMQEVDAETPSEAVRIYADRIFDYEKRGVDIAGEYPND